MSAYASVDLPEPFGPMTAWISFVSTARSTPLTISVPSSSETCRFFSSSSAIAPFANQAGFYARRPEPSYQRRQARREAPKPLLRWAYALWNRASRAPHLPRRRPAAVRRQARSRDRPLGRQGNARVQGRGLRQGRGRAAAAPPAGAGGRGARRGARGAARARLGLVAADETSAAPSLVRRGGDPRRAPRGASLPADRLHRRPDGRLSGRLRLPRPSHPLADAARARGPRDHHDRRRRALHHGTEGQLLRGARGHVPDLCLAGLELLRAGRAGAQPADRRAIRRPRHRAVRGRDGVRVLRDSAAGARLPDELRRGALPDRHPGQLLPLVRRTDDLRDRARLPTADLRHRARPAGRADVGAATPQPPRGLRRPARRGDPAADGRPRLARVRDHPADRALRALDLARGPARAPLAELRLGDNRPRMIRCAGIAAAVALVAVPSASSTSLPIRHGVGIGPVKLGMSGTQVRRIL